HDLRRQLAAIMGAASTVISGGSNLSASARSEMLETISSEAQRMDRLINNLLDMTRLESGGLAVRKEWQPLEEVVGSTLHHMKKRLNGRDVRINIPTDLPLVRIDDIAIEQVLANLIDNAIEYTPADSPIEITARADGQGT